MRLDTVESNMIHAIGYDPETQILEIIFNEGSIYQYGDVPPQVYEAFMRAESKGNFFIEHIRTGYNYWEWEPGSTLRVPGEES